MLKSHSLQSVWRTLCVLLIVACIAPLSVRGELRSEEYFDYPAGDLYPQGGWLRNGVNAEAPIQVVDRPLVYPGYQDEAKGLAARLTDATSAQRLVKSFVNDPKTDGIKKTAYMAALVNVEKAGGDLGEELYFLGLTGGASSYKDGSSVSSQSAFARIFAMPSENDGKFHLGLAKANVTPDVTTEELNLGETYLVVLRYDVVEGTKNDVVTMWVNPAISAKEPASTLVSEEKTDISSTYGVAGVILYQGGSSTRKAPVATVDAIRFGESWTDLFPGLGDVPPVVEEPSLSVSSNSVSAFSVVTVPVTSVINVKGENLTEDITISGVEAPFSTSVTTIPMDEAMSDDGYDLTVVFTPVSEAEVSGTMTLSSGDVTATVALSGSAMSATEIKNANQIGDLPGGDYKEYLYKGKATVTYIDTAKNRAYAQDMFGGLCVDFSYYGLGCKVGDVITDVVCYVEKEQGVPYLLSIMPSVTVTSTGATKEPLEVLASDILSYPENYINRLVKIADVEFPEVEGGKFTTKTVKAKAGGTDVTILPFPESTLVGSDVPEKASVIGISRSMSIVSVSPRSADDVLTAASSEPQIEVTPALIFKEEAAPINADTEIMTYTVNTVNLPNPVNIYLTGANRAMYKLSTETIPAGTQSTVVTVTYHPTAIGKHTGRINFDTTPETLATGYQFTTYAYDPENLPTITLTPNELPAFSAKVGESQEQEIKVLGANLPDNGSIKVMGEGEGSFIISSTMLSKYGEMSLRITFRPKAEGTFTERIQFSGIKAEPVFMTVTGTTTGGEAPEEKQGDEFPLSNENPLTLLTETFDGVERNKPFSIEGWKNVAVEGTRAWWGYSWEDGNKAAKITAYDSKVAPGEGKPAQMMLVTPPLDFKNAESNFVTFRVMGDNLREDMTDLFEVCYIDVVDGDMYVEPLKGLELPVTSDFNGEWIEYVMDLSSQDLNDVFFIGFRFTSTRGADNSAIYYVDDVTYGRTDVKLPSKLEADFSAKECESASYRNGFDTEADFAEWTLTQTNQKSTWKLYDTLEGVPAFSSIDSESTNSLFIAYSGSKQDESITSPEFTIKEGDRCSFYSAFSGVFQVYGSYKFNVNLPDGTVDTLFDSFDWSQENAHEAARWINFDFDLAPYVGKTVSFTFRYVGRSGEDIIIDDFKIYSVTADENSSVTINEEGTVSFIDLSKGEPVEWTWTLPGSALGTYTEQNPVVEYPEAGVYDVTLTVKNAAGELATLTREGFVTVKVEAPMAVIGTPEGAYLAPYASMHIPAGVPVTFTDLSTGKVTSRTWKFEGADIETSNEPTVTVTFAKDGVYDVDLEVSNSAGKSATYVTGINVGGEQNIWNIEVEENTSLAPVALGWYGYYGGTNWLDMTAFGEYFSRPLAKGTIASVDGFFAVNGVASPDAEIVVAITEVENGLPGKALATAKLTAKEIVSDDIFTPTTFTFPKPVEVENDFFVTISGFPNNYDEATGTQDDMALYCSPRRPDGGKSTVYHELAVLDYNYNPTGEFEWVKNTVEFLSFALSPKFAYENKQSGVGNVAVDGESAFSVVNRGGILYVESLMEIDAVMVHNMAGSLVSSLRPASATAELNIANLPAGVYLVTVKAGNATNTAKVVLR